jgi:hypothetical protein
VAEALAINPCIHGEGGVITLNATVFFFVILWVSVLLLVLFSVVSWAGLVVRVPALTSLFIAIGVTLMRKYQRSSLWLLTCIAGIVVAVSSIYPNDAGASKCHQR